MTSRTPVQLLRDRAARREAIGRIAVAHDRFSELEQMHRLLGNDTNAEGAHWYAVRVLRAYLAEVDDPKPAGLA